MDRSHLQVFVVGGLAGTVFTGVGLALGQSQAMPLPTVTAPAATTVSKAYVNRQARAAVAPLRSQVATLKSQLATIKAAQAKLPTGLRSVSQTMTISGNRRWKTPDCPADAPAPLMWTMSAEAPYTNGFGQRDPGGERIPFGPLNPDGSYTGFYSVGQPTGNFEFTDLKAGPLTVTGIQYCTTTS